MNPQPTVLTVQPMCGEIQPMPSNFEFYHSLLITSFCGHLMYIETLWKVVKWSMKWPYSIQRDLIEMFCSRHTFSLWPYMVIRSSVKIRWCSCGPMCHWLRDTTLSSNVIVVYFTCGPVSVVYLKWWVGMVGTRLLYCHTYNSHTEYVSHQLHDKVPQEQYYTYQQSLWWKQSSWKKRTLSVFTIKICFKIWF